MKFPCRSYGPLPVSGAIFSTIGFSSAALAGSLAFLTGCGLVTSSIKKTQLKSSKASQKHSLSKNAQGVGINSSRIIFWVPGFVSSCGVILFSNVLGSSVASGFLAASCTFTAACNLLSSSTKYTRN